MNIIQVFVVLLSLIEISHAFLNGSPTVDMQSNRKTRSTVETLVYSKNEPNDEYDVVVVGSGIGGLSCAAMLSLYGYTVAVFESHYSPGGVAHGYSVTKGDVKYHFDTGPSFFSGLNPNIPAKLSNPLRTILDAIDEKVECIPYTSFGLHFPEGQYIHTPSFGKKGGALDQISPNALDEWQAMMRKIEPLAAAVDALPTAALRGDLAVALTAGPFMKIFVKTNPLENLKLTKPFSAILEESVKDTFTRNWLDLLCFCLSGLPSDGTITAEMAMMIPEFYNESAVMDCPKGGARSIINALVKGIEKRGGNIFLNSHVEKITIVNGKATGIRLTKSNRSIIAKKAVVSNLSVWDLFSSGIVDNTEFPELFVKERLDTPIGKSFMHLHIGFKATREELEKLQAHYMYIDDWSRGIDSEDNAVLISIPSVHDDTLASEGYAVLHAYTPATEKYERWAGLDRKSAEYKELKEERSEYLWQVLEKIIPDIRDRTDHVQIGTPLTHERFNRRFKGSYGAAINASDGSFPFPSTPIKNLLVCGDSCFPGIGVPAVAGSGLLAANSVSLDSLKPQLQVLEKLRQKCQ
jgi:phytoene dehydrogenase-like protein